MGNKLVKRFEAGAATDDDYRHLVKRFGNMSVDKENLIAQYVDVDRFVAAGFDVNAGRCDGVSTILPFLSRGTVKQIGRLIELGADLNASQPKIKGDPVTLLDLVILTKGKIEDDEKQEFIYRIYYLISKGAKGLCSLGPLFANAEFIFNALDVDKFVEAGFDINYAMGNITPLCSAIVFQGDDVTYRLLNLGADVNKCENEGISPVYLAVITDNSNMIKRLIVAGAVPNCVADHEGGQTPLEYAIKYGYTECAEILRAAGVEDTVELTFETTQLLTQM